MALLFALAGCTGSFEVEQTEPIRVQIEGEPEETEVRSGQERRFDVQTSGERTLRFDVEVQRSSQDPSRVVLEVRDGDEVLERQTVVVEGDQAHVENFFINVEGRDNIVIVARAEEGDANVTVTAASDEPEGTGGGTVDGTGDATPSNATDTPRTGQENGTDAPAGNTTGNTTTNSTVTGTVD